MIKKPIVCLVEDNQILMENLTELLQIRYSIIQANNGYEGYQIIKSYKPDLIITDIMMPEIDGITLIRNLKSDNQLEKIPVIILSALTNEDIILKGYEKGAVDYISKPFNMKVFMAKVDAMIKFAMKTQHSIEDTDDKFLSNINKYFEFNIKNTELYIEDISKEFNISKQQLRRKLLKVSGKNFATHLNDFRLERANKHVVMTTMNVCEIAEANGYKSSSYFIKIFKKKFGKTPNDLRGNLKKGN